MDGNQQARKQGGSRVVGTNAGANREEAGDRVGGVMTSSQFEAVKESVRAAFSQMTSAEISELVMEPYAEFRRERARRHAAQVRGGVMDDSDDFNELDWINERIDYLERINSKRVWFYKPGQFSGVRANVLPWIGSDGNDTYWRQTIVLPFLGLGAMIIGLRWRLTEELD